MLGLLDMIAEYSLLVAVWSITFAVVVAALAALWVKSQAN